MKGLGIFLALGGAAVALYSLIILDPSISTAYGRFVNVGLLHQKQNLLIAGGLFAVVGVLIALLAPTQGAQRPAVRFQRALEQGDLPTMAQMIDSGVIDPNGRDTEGSNCWLRLAARQNAIPQFGLLLQKGADPRRPDGYDRSILDFLKDPKALSSKTVTEKALTAFLALIENPPAPTSPAQASAPGNEAEIAPTLASQLAQLASMHQAGQLTADEFERAKEKVLA